MGMSLPTVPPAAVSHGLHTVADLNWLGKLRLNLRRQSRAFYKSIRHPRNRHRGRLRSWMREHIRNRCLWVPERQALASGLAGGLFFAMLPIPLQSLVAAGVGISRGWYLPAAISATWLSNPFTYIPMIWGAKETISGVFGIFGQDCAAGQLSLERAGEIMHKAGEFQLREAWNMAGPAILEIGAGMVILGLLLAFAGYFLVQILWGLTSRSLARVRH